jgi:hypothetical protein
MIAVQTYRLAPDDLLTIIPSHCDSSGAFVPQEITRLLAVIRNSNVRDEDYHAAAEMLLQRGTEAIRSLKSLLKDHDPVVVSRAKDIIARFERRHST